MVFCSLFVQVLSDLTFISEGTESPSVRVRLSANVRLCGVDLQVCLRV